MKNVMNLAMAKHAELGSVGKTIGTLGTAAGMYVGGGKLWDWAMEKKKKDITKRPSVDKAKGSTADTAKKREKEAAMSLDMIADLIKRLGKEVDVTTMKKLLGGTKIDAPTGSPQALAFTKLKYNLEGLSSNPRLRQTIKSTPTTPELEKKLAPAIPTPAQSPKNQSSLESLGKAKELAEQQVDATFKSKGGVGMNGGFSKRYDPIRGTYVY